MLDTLLEWDYYLFELLNGEYYNRLFDTIIPFIRNKYFWSPVYLFLLVFLILNYTKQRWHIIIFAIITIILSDQISSHLIKPLIGRLRPCKDPYFLEQVRLLVPCGSGKSFVSAHATNHFALAIYFSSIFKNTYKYFAPLALTWAAIIAYGQVYVGVHYPMDIAAGAILGIYIGWINAAFLKQFKVMRYF